MAVLYFPTALASCSSAERLKLKKKEALATSLHEHGHEVLTNRTVLVHSTREKVLPAASEHNQFLREEEQKDATLVSQSRQREDILVFMEYKSSLKGIQF